MQAIAVATTYPAERLNGADLVIAQLADLSVESIGDEIQITCSMNTSKSR
jgi:hypothetical protein